MTVNSLSNSKTYILAGILILILLFTIIIVGYQAVETRQQTNEQEILNQLSTIADLKAKLIDSWYQERYSDASVAMNNPIFSAFLQNPTHDSESVLNLQTLMQALVDNYNYNGVVLLNADGEKIMESPIYASVSPCSDNLHRTAALNSTVPLSTDLFREEDTGSYSMEIWTPIRKTDDGPVIGLLVFQIDPEQYLYPLIQIWPLQSLTGESLITRVEGENVVFLNDLRHVSNATLNLKIPLDQRDVPAVKAALGYAGTIKGNDYRGVPVVASITNIPSTNWNLVAKIDQEEIYAPFHQYLLMVTILLIIIVIAIILILYLIWMKREHDFTLTEIMRKDHELELANRVKLLQEQAYDAILILDKEWNILEANKRAIEYYGYSLDELRLMTLSDLRTAESKSEFFRELEKISALNGVLLEADHQRKDGTKFPVESSIRTISFNGLLLRQVIIRDITERKNFEKDLLEKNTDLYGLNEELTSSYEELASQEEELRHQMEMLRINEIHLNEIQQKLNDAQESAHIGSWEYDISTDTIWGSDEGFRIYGLEPGPDNLIPIERIHDCIPEKERVYQAMKDLIDEERPYDLEFVINPADGSAPRIITSVAKLVRNGDGNPEKVIGVIQDVTERRKIEEELKVEQEKIAAFFGSNLLGLLFGDIYGNIHKANDELLRMIGYSREELNRGEIRWSDLTPPEYIPADEKGIAQAKAFGTCTPYEKQYIRKDGDRIWVLVGFVLIGKNKDESVAFVLDITQQKKDEQTIRDTTEYLHKLIQYANSLIIVWNTDFQIIEFNHACEILTGYNRDEMIGKEISFLFDTKTRSDKSFSDLKNLHGLSGIELPIRIKTGSERIIVWNTAHIVDEQGVWHAVIAQGRDVTTEKALLREKDLILNQLMINLAQMAILNDSIRNPLTVILSLAEIHSPEALHLIEPHIREIDDAINELDQKWIQSDKIFSFLRKHHDMDIRIPDDDK